MKLRSTLSAPEVDALYGALEKRLEGVGLETQPEVAARILQLVSDAAVGIREYVQVIQADPALAGRLMRLANSAFFAQRKPITRLDRACVLLGVERLKAVCLGFYLSRAAANDPAGLFSRRVWGESVFRACLASALTRRLLPAYIGEAFIVGLMMDCGRPLLRSLLGDGAARILEKGEPPTRQFRSEFSGLPYTHVDVAAVLAKRWRLPDLLAKPIEWHHRAPAETDRREPLLVLHRVAYYVGAVELEAPNAPIESAPMAGLAQRLLGVAPEELARTVKRAGAEYATVLHLFSHVADPMESAVEVADAVHQRLVNVIDDALMTQLRKETMAAPERFSIGGQEVEIEAEQYGRVVAYLTDADGKRLLSYTFVPGEQPLAALLDALGIEADSLQTRELEAYLRSMAA